MTRRLFSLRCNTLSRPRKLRNLRGRNAAHVARWHWRLGRWEREHEAKLQRAVQAVALSIDAECYRIAYGVRP